MTYMQSIAADVIERHRANLANEGLKREDQTIERSKLAETQRSNMAREAISRAELDETIRRDTEAMRHNMVSEGEIMRHNMQTEKIAQEANAIQEYAAELNYSANMSRQETDRYIADMQRESNELIKAAENRVAQINAESQRKQAQAALKNASANINHSIASLEQAEAARVNAYVNQQVAPSEIQRNRTQSLKNITSGVGDIVNSVMNITSGGATGAAGKAASKAKQASKSAKSTGPDLKNSSGKTVAEGKVNSIPKNFRKIEGTSVDGRDVYVYDPNQILK